MSWFARTGWVALTAVTLAVAAAVYLVELQAPRDAIVVDRADYSLNGGPGRPVALPYTSARRDDGPTDEALYRTRFDLAVVPEEPLFLFVPSINRRMSLILNGQPLYETDIRSVGSGPMMRVSALIHLPRVLLAAGRNDLAIRAEASVLEVPRHLSRMYVGERAALEPGFRLRMFLDDRLKTAAVAANVLLGIGILFAYFCRPRETLFSWLALAVTFGFVASVGLYSDLPVHLEYIRLYFMAMIPGLAFAFLGVAFTVAGRTPPRVLRFLVLAVPACLVLLIASGIIQSRPLVVWLILPLQTGVVIAAAGMVAWSALRHPNIEARLMLSPFFLGGWFLIRDVGVIARLVEGPVLLIPYVRPLFLASLTAILVWRLVKSLDHLDAANENLNRKLAEREAELAFLHREEQQEAARLVRDGERQRLTRDLHDGISGHLVSIIAMAERSQNAADPIEKAARQALDDLRLVIYSLDLGDRDLPLALANFRERLAAQLRRSGVELDWSTADLPEISGVTPGNALSILRIMQEAITNALKHGPATRIVVRGAPADGGMAAITVENDGRPFAPEGRGLGLENMRRRADGLNGEIDLAPQGGGTKLTLRLPRSLPDFQHPDAG